MDDEEKAILNYKPPISHMKTAMWALWFVFLTIMIVWNQTEAPADPWFTWGGWFTFVGLALFGLTPLVVSRDSPKLTSNKLGSTVASPQPILTIPAQSGHPAYGVWPGGSVKAWFVYEFATSTRAYVVAPLDLVYIIGEEGKGLNVVVNAHLEVYTNHSQLPPHILESLTTMKKPKYDENMPILYGWWVLMENKLSKEDEQKYKEMFRDIEVPEEKIEDAYRIMSMGAQKLTKFRYEDQLTNMEKNLTRREKIVNSENADLRKMIEYLKKENKDLYQRITGSKEPQQPKSIFQIPGRNRDDEERQRDREDRDY